MKKPNCHECELFKVCALRRGINETIMGNLDFVDVNASSYAGEHWIVLFETLAKVCKCYKELPQREG